jgi:hypothetical protein
MSHRGLSRTGPPDPSRSDSRFHRDERGAPPGGRTLGRCAACNEPVTFAQEWIRLYRRAWHVQCALATKDGRPA